MAEELEEIALKQGLSPGEAKKMAEIWREAIKTLQVQEGEFPKCPLPSKENRGENQMAQEKLGYEVVEKKPDGTLLLRPTAEKLEEIKPAEGEYIRSCTLCKRAEGEIKCLPEAIHDL